MPVVGELHALGRNPLLLAVAGHEVPERGVGLHLERDVVILLRT